MITTNRERLMVRAAAKTLSQLAKAQPAPAQARGKAAQQAPDAKECRRLARQLHAMSRR